MSNPPIVIVDDDPTVLNYVKLLVRRALPAAELRTFSNGESAWTQIHQHGAMALITDCQMPLLDGADLTRRCRESGFTFPVIMISGSLHCRELGEAAGANLFLEKTTMDPLLGDSLHMLLGRSAGGAAA